MPNHVKLISVCLKLNLCLMMNVFCVVAPCSVVEVYRRFRGACCLHHQGMRQQAALKRR
jgi:hypothetical protein